MTAWALAGAFGLAMMMPAHGQILLLGMGVETCESWLREREGAQMVAYREWFLGYLSATAYLRNQDVLRNQGYDQILERVTASCRRNPGRRLDAVLDEFFK
jgi:hypothetical protein